MGILPPNLGMGLPAIIFEDETMVAFDKPSGMLVAPDRWDKKRENLMGLVHEKLGHHVANVHRLDADTSGGPALREDEAGSRFSEWPIPGQNGFENLPRAGGDAAT